MDEIASISLFVKLAQKYCDLIEQALDGADWSLDTRQAWLAQVFQSLAQLYAASFDLPDVESAPIDETKLSIEISHEQWEAVFMGVNRRLKSAADYWRCFDPTEPRNAHAFPDYSNLADDLADIYRDIKDGLRQWQLSDASICLHTIREWKSLHANHWGVHAADAIPVLHKLIYFRGLQDDASP